MTRDTPYASLRRADDANQRPALDVLNEAFMNLRYGFEDLGEPVRDSPLLWPMWREPRR